MHQDAVHRLRVDNRDRKAKHKPPAGATHRWFAVQREGRGTLCRSFDLGSKSASQTGLLTFVVIDPGEELGSRVPREPGKVHGASCLASANTSSAA